MIGAELVHRPEWWPLLGVAPALLLLLWRSDRWRHRRLRRVCGPRAEVLARQVHPGRRRSLRWLAALGVLLMAMALLQPVGGPSPDHLVQQGSDLLFCLDVSRSMLARDQQPDRLGAARQLLRQWAEEHPSGRLGLVLFAGEARLAMPLTRDRQAFLALLEQADPAAVPQGGTDLKAALEVALRAVPPRAQEPVTVLLLTDGEDHGGGALDAARALREDGIRLHCIGWGTERGAKIPVPGAAGEEFLRDRQGVQVVSARDTDSLTRLARAADGEFLAALDVPRPLADLYDRGALSGRRTITAPGDQPRPGNRYQWPLLGAILAWALELAWSDRRNP